MSWKDKAKKLQQERTDEVSKQKAVKYGTNKEKESNSSSVETHRKLRNSEEEKLFKAAAGYDGEDANGDELGGVKHALKTLRQKNAGSENMDEVLGSQMVDKLKLIKVGGTDKNPVTAYDQIRKIRTQDNRVHLQQEKVKAAGGTVDYSPENLSPLQRETGIHQMAKDANKKKKPKGLLEEMGLGNFRGALD